MFVNIRVLLEYNDLCQFTLVKLLNSRLLYCLLGTSFYVGTHLFELYTTALKCTVYIALLLEIVQQLAFLVSMPPCIYFHGIHLFDGTLSVVISALRE